MYVKSHLIRTTRARITGIHGYNKMYSYESSAIGTYVLVILVDSDHDENVCVHHTGSDAKRTGLDERRVLIARSVVVRRRFYYVIQRKHTRDDETNVRGRTREPSRRVSSYVNNTAARQTNDASINEQ